MTAPARAAIPAATLFWVAPDPVVEGWIAAPVPVAPVDWVAVETVVGIGVEPSPPEEVVVSAASEVVV